MNIKKERRWIGLCLSILLILSSLLSNCVVAFGEEVAAPFLYEDENVMLTATPTALGLLPKEAELVVQEITENNPETEESYREVANKLDEKEADAQSESKGFVAYDICFMAAGQEVEPAGEIKVEMNFKNARIPEEVEEVEGISFYHIEESEETKESTVVDMFEQNKVEQCETTKEQAVTTLAFVSDSFSIFTISWGGEKQKIQSIDENGNPIGSDTAIIYQNGKERKVSELAPEQEGYTFLKAVYANKDQAVDAAKQTEVKRIRRSQGKNQYSKADTGNQWFPVKNSACIYFIYQKIVPSPELTEISTLDTADIIHLALFDYDSAINKGHTLQFNDGNGGGINQWTGNGAGVYQGIVKNILSEDGYPNLSSGESLSYLFDSSTVAGKNSMGRSLSHLFRNDNGYYSYDSSQNFAQFKEGGFAVYDATASPDPKTYDYGNFFPFNTLTKENKNVGIVEDRILYNFEQNQKGEEIIGNKKNTHFGMTMEANFSQPQNGQMNQEDMIFNFSGDDDVWVFIDDVLVLDLGGIHDKMEGSINFHTGVITVEKVAEQYQTESNYGIETNLKKVMESAGKEVGHYKGDTFADYSSHEIKFFYLERGQGASNCKLRFNIPVVPKGTIQVTKEIINTNKDIYSDVEFSFQLFLKEAEAAEEQKVINTDYQIQEGGVRVGDGKIGEDGVFKLKHNQSAVFDDMKADTLYRVEEIDMNGDAYDAVVINGQTKELESGKIAAVSMEAVSAGESPSVLFQNKCSIGNKRNLTIHKEMIAGQSSKESFDFTVELGGKPYQGEYCLHNKGESKVQSMKEGKVYLKVGEYITIADIPAGTSFSVAECDLAAGYQEPSYSIAGAENLQTEGKATGRLQLTGENAVVRVVNEKVCGQLAIVKTIDRANFNNGDPIFTFQIEGTDTEGEKFVLYRTLRFRKGEDFTQSVQLINLPLGTYTVTELQTLRYTCTGDVEQKVEITDTKPEAEVRYQNDRTYEDNYSHTDVVKNSFSKDTEGNLVIQKELTSTLRGE